MSHYFTRKTERDKTVGTGTQREYYIPIRKIDLYHILPDYQDLNAEDQERFHQFCVLLDALIHYQFHNRLNRLMQIYTHLDPDAVTVSTSDISDLLRDSLTDQFFTEFDALLERANYLHLDEKEITAAVEAASQLGVRLQANFDVFDRLEVYARGNSVETWTRRDWRKGFRKIDFDVAVFRRLIIVFRLNPHDAKSKRNEGENENYIYVKTFKNIPHSDLDVLLPGTEVKMSLMDRSKLILPTLSGIAVNLFKAWRTLVVVTVFASMWSLLGLIGLLFAITAYLAKFVFGYIRTQNKYQLSLTQHLYFQNLDNNKGGIYRLLNEAEEQDFREAAIAYFVLWQHGGQTGLTKNKLDEMCETFVKEVTARDVDFEVDDAIRKLSNLGIASCSTTGGWNVDQPEQAMEKMDEIWDNVFPYFQPHRRSSARE